MLFSFSDVDKKHLLQLFNKNKSNWFWWLSIFLQLLGYVLSLCPVSTSAPPLCELIFLLTFCHFWEPLCASAWSLWAVCHFTVTHRADWLNTQESSIKFNLKHRRCVRGLSWVWELPLSSVPHWWIIHASHHTSHTPAYVMSATRGEAYACTCVYVDVFIFRLGLRERWLTLFALSFYPTICPPTHYLFLRRRKCRNRTISLDISQLYYVVITSLHLPLWARPGTFFPSMV